MGSELADAVDSVDTDTSTAEFVTAWTVHEQETIRLSIAARRIETSGEWALDGSVSMAAWLRHHCRMANREANALIRRGRFLQTFADLADAATTGVLSVGQLDAIRTVAAPSVEEILDAQQGDLVGIVAGLSVADTTIAMIGWRQRADALIEQPEPVEPHRSLTMAVTADGLLAKAVLDTAGAVEFQQAIRNASTWDGDTDVRPNSRRSADALVDICAFFNNHHTRPGTRRQRPHVELVVDVDAEIPSGWTSDHLHHLSTAATAMMLCDCVLHRVERAGNAILNYGRAVRTVPIELFRAVANRDGGCRHPGCDRPIAWCDAHHIHYWYDMGLTDLENLVLLCNRHHHLVHRYNLRLELHPDGQLDITQPDGTVITSQPRPQARNAAPNAP